MRVIDFIVSPLGLLRLLLITHLHLPVTAVRSLGLLFLSILTLTIFIVVTDLLIKIITLAHQHIAATRQTIPHRLVLILLHTEELRVFLEKSECVNGAVVDSGSKIASTDVSVLYPFYVRISCSLKGISDNRWINKLVESAVLRRLLLLTFGVR